MNRDVDAWLKSSSSSGGGGGKKKTGGGATSLNYSRFDHIVDSDDEDDRASHAVQRQAAAAAAGPLGGLERLPPHIKAAYAKVAMAQERRDETGAALALLELEAALRICPKSSRPHCSRCSSGRARRPRTRPRRARR